MVRLKDVAHLAGYDISTVSKVLQGGNIRVSAEARERITKAAAELGYRPNLMARGLRTRRTGAIVLGLPRLDHPMYPTITAGAESAASDLGIVLFVYKFPDHGAAEALINLVRQGRADGIILATEMPTVDFFELANQNDVPVVSLNRSDDQVAPSIVLDDEAGFAAQANYLADLGHRDIAFVGANEETRSNRFCEQAFLQTLAQQGISLGKDHILRAEFDGADAEDVVDTILGLNPIPTAVAAASLAMAIRLTRTFESKGVRVPSQISVIGYHDAAQSVWVSPSITTVSMLSYQQGQLAVRRLVDLMQGGDVHVGETVCSPGQIVIRESCRSLG